jgi:hypothetical protein
MAAIEARTRDAPVTQAGQILADGPPGGTVFDKHAATRRRSPQGSSQVMAGDSQGYLATVVITPSLLSAR